MRLLLHVLLVAVAFGALHVTLGRRRPPGLEFVAAGAAAHVVIGLALLAPALAGQVGRSPWTIAWIPLFGLGLFVVGVVLATAWLLAVTGVSHWLSRRS